MDVSIFLAKVMGLYLFIMAIGMFLNVKQVRTILTEMNTAPRLFLSGAITLILGLLLVISHNIWESDYRMVITIIGWLTLIKGTIRVLFPQYVAKMIGKFMQNTKAYYFVDVLLFVVGIYLSYTGFMS